MDFAQDFQRPAQKRGTTAGQDKDPPPNGKDKDPPKAAKPSFLLPGEFPTPEPPG